MGTFNNNTTWGKILNIIITVLTAKSAPNAEEFSTSLIKDVKVRREPSAEFKDLINDAAFEYVGTRESQTEARKAEKERLNALATIQPGEDSPEDDDEQGGTNQGE